MNEEKLKKFLVPILVLLISVLAVFYLGKNIYSSYQTYTETKNKLAETQQKLDEAKTKLQNYQKKEAEMKAKSNSESGKPFFKPIFTGMDTEAVIAGEFAEILQLIRANKIKVRSIKYDYDPADDNFVKGAGAKYNAARLNMEMIGNYVNYDNFIRELYKHPHFLDIQSIEIVPYRKNKRILLINFKLKLYAEK